MLLKLNRMVFSAVFERLDLTRNQFSVGVLPKCLNFVSIHLPGPNIASRVCPV
jgi:hypothetical protein